MPLKGVDETSRAQNSAERDRSVRDPVSEPGSHFRACPEQGPQTCVTGVHEAACGKSGWYSESTFAPAFGGEGIFFSSELFFSEVPKWKSTV
jgi:hypothetical protein